MIQIQACTKPPRYRELLSAALQGEATAVTPVALWRHHPEQDQQAETLAASTLRDQARFDADFVKLTPASTWQTRDQGLQDRWAGDPIGRREITHRQIHTHHDWQRLQPLNPWHGFSGRILRAARQVRHALPPEIPLLATVFNPIFQAVQLAGLERVREHARTHPTALQAGLSVLLANTLAIIEQLADLGVDGLFLATQHAGRAALAPEPYGSLALAADQVCLAAAPLPFTMLHLHGPDLHWEPFATLDGTLIHYDAIPGNPAPDLLAQRVSRGIATGPSPAGQLLHGTPATLTAEILALRQRLIGQRFILAPGCALPLAVTEQQITTLIQAARRPLPPPSA